MKKILIALTLVTSSFLFAYPVEGNIELRMLSYGELQNNVRSYLTHAADKQLLVPAMESIIKSAHDLAGNVEQPEDIAIITKGVVLTLAEGQKIASANNIDITSTKLWVLQY